MKAIITTQPLPIVNPDSLLDVERPAPVATGRDLLVRIHAVAINPVDTKVRSKTTNPDGVILGWDAAGTVEEVGEDVTGFHPGDEVYYAGDVTRSGSNAELQLVDERIVARKPAMLTFEEAAAFPLVSITAWEALYERLGIARDGSSAGKTLLIIGGAGGVGSVAIQFARLAGLIVIATASRPETRDWVTKLGAQHDIDHRQPLPPQLTALGHAEVDYIANFSNTDTYWSTMAEVIKPQGRIVSIVENSSPLDLNLLKSKSATFVWEFMFTRSMYQTPDMAEQGKLLAEIAHLLDTGMLQTIATVTLTGIHAANLRTAHDRAESGSLIGKLVLSGW